MDKFIDAGALGRVESGEDLGAGCLLIKAFCRHKAASPPSPFKHMTAAFSSFERVNFIFRRIFRRMYAEYSMQADLGQAATF
ncbi:MAG: hypothetical protein LBU32_14345 [Clostridiales bacterium]|jgi:hypothetical protein|nr:hypothetical protein [Clostridiales bacterium]